MLLRRLILCAGVLVAAAGPVRAQAGGPVAIITEQQGDVRVHSTRNGGKPRHLQVNDVIRTGPGGSVRVTYVSGARAFVAANSVYTIVDPSRTAAAATSGRAFRTLFGLLAEAVGISDAAASGDGSQFARGEPGAPVLVLASPRQQFLPVHGDTLALNWSRVPETGRYRVVLYRPLDAGVCDGYADEVGTVTVTDTLAFVPWPAGVKELRVEVEGLAPSAPTCFRRHTGAAPEVAIHEDPTSAKLNAAGAFIQAGLLADGVRVLVSFRHPRPGVRDVLDDLWRVVHQRTQYPARLVP